MGDCTYIWLPKEILVWSYQLHWYLRQAFLFISFFPPSSFFLLLLLPSLPSFLPAFLPSFSSLLPAFFTFFLSLLSEAIQEGGVLSYSETQNGILKGDLGFLIKFFLCCVWESFTRVLLDKKGNLCLEKYMYVLNSPFCNDLMSKNILWSL